MTTRSQFVAHLAEKLGNPQERLPPGFGISLCGIRHTPMESAESCQGGTSEPPRELAL